MSALEIEEAIRQLPADEAAKLIARIPDLIPAATQKQVTPLSDEAIEKWRVKSGFPVGLSTDEYLKIIRDGGRD